MIDIHTHILPFLDDGPDLFEESLKILKYAETVGITKIICTPHFIEGSYDNFSDKVISVFDNLKQKAKEENIKIELYPGAELYFDTELIEKILSKKVLTLNNGKYALIEFPMVSIPKGAQEIFYKMQLKGYFPVLCHPERNQEIVNNYRLIKDFTSRGVYIQINTGSLLGNYGTAIKNAAIELIKEKNVHFIASDAHKLDKKIMDFNKCLSIISKYIEVEKAVNLVTENPMKILKSIEFFSDEEETENREGFLKKFIKYISG